MDRNRGSAATVQMLHVSRIQPEIEFRHPPFSDIFPHILSISHLPCRTHDTHQPTEPIHPSHFPSWKRHIVGTVKSCKYSVAYITSPKPHAARTTSSARILFVSLRRSQQPDFRISPKTIRMTRKPKTPTKTSTSCGGGRRRVSGSGSSLLPLPVVMLEWDPVEFPALAMEC